MNKITIVNNELQIKEYKGQRVVTLKDIDLIHERAEGTARRNFNNNKGKFIINEDYVVINQNDVRTKFVQTYGFDKKAPSGILITESGYLMLVKSFTDDLAWKVQRALVKTYFKAREIANAENSNIKEKLAEAKLKNAKAREASLLFKIAQMTPNETYKQVLMAKSAQVLNNGELLLPLPQIAERTYSAEDIGKELGISAYRVGRLTNQHGLKTDEYGQRVWDKSRSSNKQVETFRYYGNIIEKLRAILNEVA